MSQRSAHHRGPHAILVHITGPKRRHVIRPGQTYEVGRTQDVTVRLTEDTEVSRRHARIELRPGGLFVTDLESTNGSQVDRRLLRPLMPRQARDGSVLTFGNTHIAVRMVGFGRKRQQPRQRSFEQLPLPREEFEVLGKLGSGAMGGVWSARQLMLDRLVAVKVLHCELPIDGEEHRRFIREARLFRRIRSPYVVELYDARVVDRRPCLIMELVQGPTAEDRVELEPLPIAEAVKIGQDIARALAAVASAGIVHRDVKPANILLSPAGRAKLGDFGISKEFDAHSSLTDPGIGLGSFPYIAPEQARGRKLEPRADVYALGATLYHLVMGTPHYHWDGKNVLEAYELMAEKPASLEQRTDCPPELARLVQRMMAREPRHRPHAADVARHLTNLARDLGGAELETWRRHQPTKNMAAVDLDFDDELTQRKAG